MQLTPQTQTLWSPNPGPQAEFLASPADECLYGGAAGGGKSAALVALPLRWIEHPRFNALVLRRDTPQLRDLIDKSEALYPQLGAKLNATTNTWRFPSGARVWFTHCEHEQDVRRFDGHEFHLCVAKSTPVLMASGEWKPIDTIRVGEQVATLEGPRRVTRTWSPGKKPVARVTGPYGSAVVSLTHPLLTARGDWASPSALRPMGCCGGGSKRAGSLLLPQDDDTLRECQHSDRSRACEHAPRRTHGSLLPATCAFPEAQGIGCATSESGPRARALPAQWFARLVLFARALPPEARGTPRELRGDAPFHGSQHSESQDSQCDCHDALGCDGAQARPLGEDDREHIPPQAGVASPPRARSPVDGQASTPSRTRCGQSTPRHPYTKEPLALIEDVLHAQVQIDLAGEEEVFDLTVEGASHYVAWGGFIARNCCFDELTHFSEKQYRAIRARIRGTDPALPRQTRATTNPGGDGHEWVFARFAAWLDPTQPRRALPAKLRWYGADGEVPQGAADALSRTFIPARLEDNPHVTSEYRAMLAQLDPVRRAQLLSGDWLKRAAPKDFWDRARVTHCDAPPADAVARVRCWDLAASVDGDWTVGVRASISKQGVVTIEHVERFRGRSDAVHARFAATALADKTFDARTVQWLPRDPGQAGPDQVRAFQIENPGIAIRDRRPSGDKLTRFGPASARALTGTLQVVRGPWNGALHDELEEKPAGRHDDQMDAVSDAVAVLTGDVPASLDTASPAHRASLPKPRL